MYNNTKGVRENEKCIEKIYLDGSFAGDFICHICTGGIRVRI